MTHALDRIQRVLVQLYDLDGSPDVRHFVCGRELVEETVGHEVAARSEALLVLHDEEGVHVAVYLDDDVVRDLEESDADFRSVCLATEGVSHFLYLAFRASNDESVSQLELELQAEVDKYAASLLVLTTPQDSLSGFGVGAIRERSRAIRARLFHGARFIDDADTPEGERYRVAHRLAARYTAHLEARFLDHRVSLDAARLDALLAELRRFYRMGSRQKLEHLRTRS